MGFTVGEPVGLGVVGDLLGDEVGFLVGEGVGFFVGKLVGFSVMGEAVTGAAVTVSAAANTKSSWSFQSPWVQGLAPPLKRKFTRTM